MQPIFSAHLMGLHLIKGKVTLCTFGNLHVEQSRIFPNTRTSARPIEEPKKFNLSYFVWFSYSSVLFKHAFML